MRHVLFVNESYEESMHNIKTMQHKRLQLSFVAAMY